MTTAGEILQLSRVREAALTTLTVHTPRRDGTCALCGGGPCPAAGAALKVIAWCERRVAQINAEINDGIADRAGQGMTRA